MLPSYRGDIINRPEFTDAARLPDPWLMLRGYERAALTLNFIRALVSRGFVDPHRLEYWEPDWVKDSPVADEYRRMARSIGESIRFMENILGVHPGDPSGSTSSPATRGCICPTSRRKPGGFHAIQVGTICPLASRGLACGRPIRREPMLSTFAASAIRSV
jgi:Class-II DAHP synthetase family